MMYFLSKICPRGQSASNSSAVSGMPSFAAFSGQGILYYLPSTLQTIANRVEVALDFRSQSVEKSYAPLGFLIIGFSFNKFSNLTQKP